MTSRSPLSSATPFILPTLTTLLGLTGLASGTYALLHPFDAIGPFGLRPPPSFTSPAAGKVKSTSSSNSHAEAFSKSVIKAYGLRNIGTAFSLVGMTLFWKLSPLCKSSPLAAEAARKCIGLGLMVGTGVAVGDAWVVRAFGESEGVAKDAAEEAIGTSKGHAFMSIPILAVGVALFFY